MPSLEQLKNFKASFGNIADEAMVLSQLELPPDDLPLPSSEPAAPSVPPLTEMAKEKPALDVASGPDLQTDDDFTGGGETLAEPDTDTFSSPESPLPGPAAPVPPAPTSEVPTPAAPDLDLGLGFNFADLLGGGSANLPPPPAAETAIEEALSGAGASAGETALPEETDVGPGDATDSPGESSDAGFDEAFSDLDDIDTETALPGEADTGFDEDFADIGDATYETAEADDLDLGAGFPGFDDSAAFSGEDTPAGDEPSFPDITDTATGVPEADDLDLDAGFPGFDDNAAFSGEGTPAGDEPSFPDITDTAAGVPEADDLDLDAGFPGFDDSAADTASLLDGFADDIEAEQPGDGDSAGKSSVEADFGGAFPDMADMPLEKDGGEAEFLVPDIGVDLSPEGDAGNDPFEGFSPDGGEASLSGGEKKDAGHADSDIDFTLPDIDDLFGSHAPKIAGMETGAAGAGPAASGGDAVEEIRLSEDEFDRLRQTLADYPLNLRIALEEIIVKQAIAPNLMSSLIKLLVRGGSAKEASSLAGKILGKPVPIPRGFEKKTGEELEAEQSSFPYIFAHKFLPVLRLFLVIAMLAASLFYLGYEFIYTPVHANSIYKQGYELIPLGSYAQANERFNRAFQIQRQKDWFYKYAEAFRDERQFIYAEEKYDQLLTHYPRDKKGALDYAGMETNYLRNYAKADRIIRLNVLEYSIDDREGLLALGDNNLIWGELDPSRYEEARSAYARLLERYGWQDPIVERMLRYFIRVDNLGEVIPLQQYFMSDPSKRQISAASLAELGGYLLDKRFEEVRGVPDEHITQIEGIRDILIRAVQAAPRLPEAHYHLARYYNHFGNNLEEHQTLDIAARAFDAAPEESTRRTQYRLDTQRRLGEILIKGREFFAAEEQLIKGISIYEDALDRRFLTRSPEFGRLYADLGDLEYFTKSGNMPQALEYYLQAEQNGWNPPEIQYRMGAAYYQQKQWAPALDRFFAVSSVVPPNRRLLNALGNVSYMRGNYFHAQGYYDRLQELLDTERARFPMLMPNDRPEHLELTERMMVVRNNLAVALEALTKITGNRNYRSRALGLYAESARAWDSLTRNPDTMLRSGAGDISSPGMNLAFLNSRNALYPEPDYEPQLYIQIDKDMLEPSAWENLVPQDFRITNVVEPYRQR
jgi:tetratricopeptide (TPR) repeat protein